MVARPKVPEIAVAAMLAVGGFAHAGLAQEVDIQPQQSDKPVTMVDEIISISPLVPVPKVGQGAPMYSSDELAAIGRQARRENNWSREAAILQECYLEAYNLPAPDARLQGFVEAHRASLQISAFAQAAQYASQEALVVRRAAAEGKATREEVEQAELERQKTVLRVIATQNALMEGKAKALDAQQLVRDRISTESWQGMIDAAAAERSAAEGEPWNPVPKEFRDLLIENVKAVNRDDSKGGAYLQVSGAIRNTRAKRITIPPLSISAIDEEGFALVNETATARGRIDPGAAIPFAYQLRPVPPRAKTVAITFGDRDRQAWLLPASADPVCVSAPEELDPARGGGLGRRGFAPPTGRARGPGLR